MARLLQVAACCLLAMVAYATASPGGYYGGYYGGSQRRLTGFGRELQSAGYYYGYGSSAGRRLQESGAPFLARPLFSAGALPGAVAAAIPVPHFLSRQLQSAGYYGGSSGGYYGARRLQGAGNGLGRSGRGLSYYGGYYGAQ